MQEFRGFPISDKIDVDDPDWQATLPRIISFLEGRPLSDFGFTTLDQVHGQSHQPPCGCHFHLVFDHHERFNSPKVQVHRSLKCCDVHKDLPQHTQAHWDAANAHCAREQTDG